MMENKEYYKTLQVDQDAEQEIIVVAYKRLALKYHPDINKSPIAVSIMQEINTAYNILSNPVKRAKYDFLIKSESFGSGKSDLKRSRTLIYKSDFIAPRQNGRYFQGRTQRLLEKEVTIISKFQKVIVGNIPSLSPKISKA